MTCIDPVEMFLHRWLGQPGGAERANAQMFLSELCTLLEVEPPRPAAGARPGDYVFERPVRQRPSFGQEVCGRMDLYKRDCFVLESKQSHQGDEAEPAGLDTRRGHRLSGGGWDRLMIAARAQAEGYVDRLPPDHPAPPFMIICDIGHVFEVFADFTGTGRGYSFFPDRRDYRIFLADLRRPEIRDRLRAIWTDPYSLDPSRRREKVTQEIASDMAAISRRLEQTAPPGEGVEHRSQEVARFLMRCIFCMFAASVDLLPRTAFLEMLDDCIAHPPRFVRFMRELWRMMNDPEPSGRYMSALDAVVPFTGGDLFSDAHVFALDAEAIRSLRRAAARAWSDVEPSIFGAILEQALAPAERRRLGVHFTPAGHVRRLVRVTLGEPLRHDWLKTTAAVERLRDLGQIERARKRVRSFHQRLKSVRVLDPACGSGNFLYIALETVKGLEAEVMETLSQLGEPELLAFEMVDPGQFYGLEINPRAVVLAELVLWIGYLQLHYKGQVGHPSEPILHAYGTIRRADAVLEWDGAPEPLVTASGDAYPNPRQPDWPEVDFIVGNPPFLGGKDLRTRLGDAYAEALWAAHPEVNRSADLVMYWWDHAAALLTRPGARLKRFGFVTTNSLTQTFQRRVVAKRLNGDPPVRLLHAIPDHPWTGATKGAAAVRVAMTVAAAGSGDGVRYNLSDDGRGNGDPHPVFTRRRGRLNSGLTIGPDPDAVEPLLANQGLCSPGVKLHGAGFIVSPAQARDLGLGRRPGLEAYIRPYRNGRDVVQAGRGALVIDLYPLPACEVRDRFPEVYEHLLATVKPHRDANRMAFRRENWWWFGATHALYRSFTAGLPRYICTPETAKHRLFTVLPADVRADNMLVNIGLEDGFHLGVLSCDVHTSWALAVGAVLEDRPRYTKSACFDPFPFPDPPPGLRQAIARTAEDMLAVRSAIQAEHPELTLTAIYNAVAAGSADARARAGALRELHAQLNALVRAAYGWDEDLCGPDLVSALISLNLERRAEEREGQVRWLRPDYQCARFKPASRPLVVAREDPAGLSAPADRLAFPSRMEDQSMAVLEVVAASNEPLSVGEVAARFQTSGRRRVRAQVEAALPSLLAYGHLSRMADGRFAARRVA